MDYRSFNVMNSSIWIVQAHYVEDRPRAEPSEILAVCPTQCLALEYQQAWESSVRDKNNPKMYVTVTPHPLLATPAPQHYFAIEWNEVLARMQVPCIEGSQRFYDKVLPTRFSIILSPEEEDQSTSFTKQVISESPLIIVWRSLDEATVIEQWKQHDNNYLKDPS